MECTKTRKPRFWTEERCDVVRTQYNTIAPALIAVQLGVSVPAVRNQAAKLAVAKRNGHQHKWTDEERAIVRRDYKGTCASARDIAQRLGVTQHAVKGQVQKMGIAQNKSPNWTRAEIAYLRQNVHRKSLGQIAKALHRSDNAVKVKAVRLQLRCRARDGWYTKIEVAEICGVDHKKVQAWIDNGVLQASWHFQKKPEKGGCRSWHIEEKDLRNFLIAHSGELLGRNVDIQQIIWIVSQVNYLPYKEKINATASNYTDPKFRAHLSAAKSAL